MWKRVNKLKHDRTPIILFAQTPFDKVLGYSNIKELKYEWIWNKLSPTGHLNAKKMPMKKTENILIFYKKLPTYNPQGLEYCPRIKKRSSKSIGSSNYGKHNDENLSEYKGYPTNLLEFMREGGLHPTQKPVALLEYLINTYTMDALDFLKMFDNDSVDGVVYDPPCSVRQVSECYKSVGIEVAQETTRSDWWTKHKKEIARIVKSNGKVICFGWNSMGIGKTNNFKMVKILLVPHGGIHNDTIVTVEHKILI